MGHHLFAQAKQGRSSEEEKMSPDLHSEIEQLRERVTRLERVSSKPRGRTNLAGAARYLGKSEEWLRQQHARGEGPHRTRSGTRNWSYAYDDLDAYAEQSAA
jgi:hypothetical protein